MTTGLLLTKFFYQKKVILAIGTIKCTYISLKLTSKHLNWVCYIQNPTKGRQIHYPTTILPDFMSTSILLVAILENGFLFETHQHLNMSSRSFVVSRPQGLISYMMTGVNLPTPPTQKLTLFLPPCCSTTRVSLTLHGFVLF